ncbi:hypothetical protein MJO47_14630 [Desulfuromonas sp. KJ2020]|uniref:hypothetical protein n=1 Tax=Desulfuromonas sp. KJ2020 TaxID=2919173 RepID=UPI0020A70D3B|nr:hypothetical protein [Desulfuromonas sp. KJ2020]MCP3178338.1 hypothetical protein [Desulfuromonas sp. KJ2020]
MSKNSFFYNPQFRLMVYIFYCAYFGCFNLLTLISTKVETIIHRYEEGDSIASGIIGFTSGLIFTVFFTLLAAHKIEWTTENILKVPAAYLLASAIGWLALEKQRYYENEEID